jgi:uncharacterized protein YdbL (DUF1318 family)
LLLAQLPASPSSARVALWRRVRAVGAVGLQNGAWVLPMTAEHVALFEQLAATVGEQGGSGVVLIASASTKESDAAIVTRFQSDRAREYEEFAERCAALLAEVEKETGRSKFTFAELEEIEQDLDKLSGWLDKIQARDFFPDERHQRSVQTLQRCRQALSGFAQAVYAAEGLHPGGDDSGPTGAGPDDVNTDKTPRYAGDEA